MSNWSGVGTPVVAPVAPSITDLGQIKLLTYDRCEAPVFIASAIIGGTLSAGSYLLEITSVTQYGESLSETSISLTAAGGDQITGLIYKAENAVKYRIYVDGIMQQEITQLADENTEFEITALVSGTTIPVIDTATIHLSADNYNNAYSSACNEYYQYFRRTTINADHTYGVIYLAASYACLQIAAKYAHTSNKLLNADSVDYKMRADDFRKMAAEYKKKGYELTGMGRKRGETALGQMTRQSASERLY